MSFMDPPSAWRDNQKSSNYSSLSTYHSPPETREQKANRLRQRQVILNQQYAERLMKLPVYGETTQLALNNPITQNPPLIPSMATIEQTGRITAITTTINALKRASNGHQEQKLHHRLSILLGPRTFLAPIKAKQIFYSTESIFYQQCYWILLSVAQTYFQEALASENKVHAFSQLDAFHEQHLETRELKTTLSAFVITYAEAFPECKEKAHAFFNRLFNGNLLQGSLLDTIEKAHKAFYESVPFMRDLPLPPPADYETLTEPAYTLSSLESSLIAREKMNYQKSVTDYLQLYPEEATFFKKVFELNDVPMEQLSERLSEQSAYLPPDGLGSTLIQMNLHYHPLIEDKLMARGAMLPLNNQNDWYSLKKMLSFYASKNSRDEAFRRQMLTYCEKDHDQQRWEVLADSFNEVYSNPSRSLLEAVYEKTVLKKKGFFESSYRLLEIADSCMKSSSEKMAPFFATLPQKIAIFQPSIFEEAQNRSFWAFLQLGSAILAKQNIKVVVKSETTSEDSSLSDGTPRFEEVDENGEPLHPVEDSKISSDSERDDDVEENEESKSDHYLPVISRSPEAERQAHIDAHRRELFLQMLSAKDDDDYRGWREIQQILRIGVDKYNANYQKSDWTLMHYGAKSMNTHQTLKEVSSQTIKAPVNLIVELTTLQKHFLELSKSSLREGSLDTPIVLGLQQMLERMQDDALATLLREEMGYVSPDEAMAVSRQPFLMRNFPAYFPERRPRYLERAKLGLAFKRSAEVMEQLVGTEDNPGEFQKEANTSFSARVEAKGNRRFEEYDKKIARLEKDMMALQSYLQCGLKQTTTLVFNEIKALNQRVDTLEPLVFSQSDVNGLSEAIYFLQASVTELEKQIQQNHQDGQANQKAIADLRQALNEQQQQLNILQVNQPPQSSDLTPEQTRYVEAFEKTMTGVYLAAYMISTGLFSANASGNFGKSAKILDFFANVTPFAGGGMKILSALLQATDEKLLGVRMQRLQNLGGLLEFIALSKQLAIKLLGCLDLANPVSDDMLTKLLSTATDVVDAMGGAFFEWIQAMGIDKITDSLLSPESDDMTDRGQQDASLLIARVCQDGVPEKPFESILLLYAAPLLPMADSLFFRILSLFCVVQNCEQNQITWQPRKQQTFYVSVTQSFEHHATEMEERVINREKRDEFLANMAHCYTEHTSNAPDGTAIKSIFYFKEESRSDVPGYSFFGQMNGTKKSNCCLRVLSTLPDNLTTSLPRLTGGIESVYLYAEDNPTQLHYWVPKTSTRLTLRVKPEKQTDFMELLQSLPKNKRLSNENLKAMVALTVPLKPHVSMHNNHLEAGVADEVVSQVLTMVK